MKKRLVLALVLGLAGLAGAALRISVNGDKDPQDLEYSLLPSQTLTLELWTDMVITGDGGYFALGVRTSQGTIWGGNGPDDPPHIDIIDPEIPFPIEGMNGIVGGIVVWGPESVPAGSIVFENIMFHCAGPGNAVIQLWQINEMDWSLGAMLDQVVITQPEPMTMLLLGLGGLFLRKRK